MDKRPIINKWYARLLSIALVFAVLCGMGWPGRAMVADAVESSETEVTPGEVALGEVTPGDPEEDEESLADTYLREIAALKAEAEAIGGTTADVTSMCAGVNERLMGVYDEAFAAWEADRITDDEMDAVDAAIGEVMAVLNGYGYDPYAVDLAKDSDMSKDMQDKAEYYWDNISNVNNFYWRFDTGLDNIDTDDTGNDIDTENPYANKVTVTYSNYNVTDGIVPYHYFKARNNATVLTCASALGASSESDYNTKYTDSKPSIHISTEVGYVVTSYLIACESYEYSTSSGGFSGNQNQSGEGCKTAASQNLTVNLDTTGLYRSDFTIDLEPKNFGHMFNSMSKADYVLLITIAEVNVNLKVDKTADKESVSAGELINYTVTATTTNDLTNVKFSDEFLKNATEVSVSYGENPLNKVDSTTNFSYESDPNKYYLDSANGILYLDGKWTSEYTIAINYSYETTESQANSTLTNTVIATGTKTNTTDTVEDMGVAQVNVIVNQNNKGSIRVYKTFSGLTTEEVVGEDGVLNGYSISITDPDGNSVTLNGPTFYSSQTTASPYTYTYFWDATSLEPGNYTVIESEYEVEGYSSTAAYTVQVGTGTESKGNGYTATPSVEAGKTTIVRFNNSYVNAEIAVKVVKKWQDASGNELTLTESDELPAARLNLYADDGMKLIKTFELTKASLDTNENAWIEYFVLDEQYHDSSLTLEEESIDGYALAKDISVTTGQIYTVTTTVIEKDDEGNETSREESKTYDCTVFTAINKPSVTDVTVTKQVSGSMGDQAKEFKFEAKVIVSDEVYYLTDGNGYTVNNGDGTISFGLIHNGTVTLSKVPLGAKLLIKEINANGYTITVNGTTISNDEWYETTVTNDLTVGVSNFKDVIPDTGVLLDSLPYILILAIVIAVVVVMIICRRRIYDED